MGTPRNLAPQTKPRAALKPMKLGRQYSSVDTCTTNKAACGIETVIPPIIQCDQDLAPQTKPRAALKHLIVDIFLYSIILAPQTKPRAALKHRNRRLFLHRLGLAPPTKPRAALKPFAFIHKCEIELAPQTKPRAALKPSISSMHDLNIPSCTTNKAACGIETQYPCDGYRC